ncbi:FHA domain-containing protein [Lysobacter sp. CA199]|uniref:FHA domain-containing protein n=1 Tax=Lysobacter sp. CA199 TaxID=3455608 RepID=UPI003F8D230C
MPARLIAYPPEAAAISRWIPAGARLRIGREADCDVRIEHPTVSRNHAELSHDADGWHLLDLGSKNGTHVDGIEISRTQLDRSDCWLRFGDVLCEFSVHEDDSALDQQRRQRERRELSAAWTRRIEVDRLGIGAGRDANGPRPADAASSDATDPHTAGDSAGETATGAGLADDILRGVVELAGCSRGFLLLAHDGDFSVRASLMLDRQALQERAFSGSVGAVQRCLSERRPIVVNWIADELWLARRASVLAGGLKSLVCLPLLHAGRVLGAVYADRRGPGEAISEFDLELLCAFADSAALWLLAQRAFDSLGPAAEAAQASRWTRIVGAQVTAP